MLDRHDDFRLKVPSEHFYLDDSDPGELTEADYAELRAELAHVLGDMPTKAKALAVKRKEQDTVERAKSGSTRHEQLKASILSRLDEITSLREQGLAMEQVALNIGTATQTLTKVLREVGFEVKRRSNASPGRTRLDAEIDVVKGLVASGMTRDDLCQRYGVTRNSLNGFLARHRIRTERHLRTERQRFEQAARRLENPPHKGHGPLAGKRVEVLRALQLHSQADVARQFRVTASAITLFIQREGRE